MRKTEAADAESRPDDLPGGRRGLDPLTRAGSHPAPQSEQADRCSLERAAKKAVNSEPMDRLVKEQQMAGPRFLPNDIRP